VDAVPAALRRCPAGAGAGVLGDVRTVLADHGERFDPPHRILDPAMAGGSLLDLGSYLTALATWTLGPAQDVYATGEMTPSGVNGQAAMVLTHGGGARSVLHTTLLTRTPTAAVIAGTAATLTLPRPFFMPGDVVLTSADGGRTVTWAEPEPIGHPHRLHLRGGGVRQAVLLLASRRRRRRHPHHRSRSPRAVRRRLSLPCASPSRP
jgi:predicted dehydrogenase